MFESTVLLAAKERPGRTVELSPVRAAQALRLSREGLFWAADEEHPIDEMRKNTRITARDGEVEICVRGLDKFFVRDMALELSWLFRSMDEEEELGSIATNSLALLDSHGDDYKELDQNRRSIVRLMNEDCLEAGLPPNFRTIPMFAAEGSPEALKLWADDSFWRRWKFYEDATWKLAGGPRSDLPQLTMTGYPQVSDHAVSPNIKRHQSLGLFAGVVFGAFVGYRRSLKIKTPPLPEAPNTVPVDRGEAPQEKQRPTPEEEW